MGRRNEAEAGGQDLSNISQDGNEKTINGTRNSSEWQDAGREARLITIYVNGEAREVPDGLTLAALLDRLEFPPDRIAVERNREIVPRARWPETPVQPGDRLEVVHFVGGGGAGRATPRRLTSI